MENLTMKPNQSLEVRLRTKGPVFPVGAGTTIVGGCCGVEVEHIRALAEGL